MSLLHSAVEIEEIFCILKELSHDRRRILFGDSSNFKEWLEEQNVKDTVSDEL